MKSAMPKVMHNVAGLPDARPRARRGQGGGRDASAPWSSAPAPRRPPNWSPGSRPTPPIYEQAERLGTAHAVLAARKEFAGEPDDVLVLYGDTPLVTGQTLSRIRRALARGADVVVLGFRPADPDRLWPADRGEGPARGDPRGEGRDARPSGRSGSAMPA